MTPIPRPAPSSRSGPTGDRVGTPDPPTRRSALAPGPTVAAWKRPWPTSSSVLKPACTADGRRSRLRLPSAVHAGFSTELEVGQGLFHAATVGPGARAERLVGGSGVPTRSPVGPLLDDRAGLGIGIIGNDEILPAGDLHRPEVDLESQVATALGGDDIALGHPPDRPRPVVAQELGTLRGMGGATPPRDPLALGRPLAHTCLLYTSDAADE